MIRYYWDGFKDILALLLFMLVGLLGVALSIVVAVGGCLTLIGAVITALVWKPKDN